MAERARCGSRIPHVCVGDHTPPTWNGPWRYADGTWKRTARIDGGLYVVQLTPRWATRDAFLNSGPPVLDLDAICDHMWAPTGVQPPWTAIEPDAPPP